MDDKISIIIPVFNLEKYIKRTLDSVCRQTYLNLEILVVDDGSKDESWRIICKCAEKDSRIIPIHQENGGVTSARLNGVKHASGEWIGFVDGDDLIDEDMFELLISNAIKYNAQISHCGYKMVFGDGVVRYLYNTERLIEQDTITGLKDLLQGAFVEPGLCNKLFHITLFRRLLHDDIVDYSIANFEDLLTNYYLFKQSKKSVYEDKCKYSYMIRSNSANTSKISYKKFDDVKRVFEIIMQDTDTSHNRELYNISFARYICYLINNSTSSDKDCTSVCLSVLRKNFKNIICCKHLSLKRKAMSIFTTYLHPLYLFVRILYDKYNKKNEVFFE